MTTPQTQTSAIEDRKRFTTGDHPDIEDVADPHTLEDDTTEPITAKLKRNWKIVALTLSIAIPSVAIIIGYTWHLVPAVLGNFWVQLGAAFAAAIATSAYMTNQWRLGWFRAQNELVLRTPNGPLRFNCKLRQNKYGGPVAVPVKGYRLFNTSPEYYTIEEFGRELGLTWSNANHDPDDPAEIELHPKLASAADTELGTVIEQSTGEKALKVDPFARESTLYATIPVTIEEDVAEDLRSELIREREERQELEDRLNDVKRRLEAAKDVGAMTPEEFLDSHKEFSADMMAVARGRKRPSETDDGENPAEALEGGSNGSSYDFSDIESELATDD